MSRTLLWPQYDCRSWILKCILMRCTLSVLRETDKHRRWSDPGQTHLSSRLSYSFQVNGHDHILCRWAALPGRSPRDSSCGVHKANFARARSTLLSKWGIPRLWLNSHWQYCWGVWSDMMESSAMTTQQTKQSEAGAALEEKRVDGGSR